MNTDIEITPSTETMRGGLLRSLIEELEAGLGLIAQMDDIAYCRSSSASGSVGGQFRHNLDFVGALLKGIASGRIDFNDRERDERVENDRHYAARRFGVVIERLSELNPRLLGKAVLVRSEVENSSWLPSSVAREVEFVHSHTVHHHALIAEKLAGFNIAVGNNFGVARSTVEYRQKIAA